MAFGDAQPVMYEAPSLIMERTYSVDGITFNERDIYGVEWWIEPGKDKGWFEAVAPRTNRVARPGADGYYRAKSFKEGRSIVLEGIIKAPSLQARDFAKQRLSGLLADGGQHDLIVTDYLGDGYPKKASVELDGAIMMEDLNDDFTRFSVQMYAVDPIKYSSEVESVVIKLAAEGGGMSFPVHFPINFGDPPEGGVYTLVNEGNSPIQPKFSVLGTTLGAVTVTHLDLGVSWTYSQQVGPGEFVLVDTFYRAVLAQGIESRRYYFSGSMFPLLPGSNSITFTCPEYHAESGLSVEWHHGWR